MAYAKNHDKNGCWIFFEDGHSEFWSNSRIEADLKYWGIDFLVTQIKFLLPYKDFHDHIKNHFSKEHPDWKVICKICGKSFEEITKEEQRNSYLGREKFKREMIRDEKTQI